MNVNKNSKTCLPWFILLYYSVHVQEIWCFFRMESIICGILRRLEAGFIRNPHIIFNKKFRVSKSSRQRIILNRVVKWRKPWEWTEHLPFQHTIQRDKYQNCIVLLLRSLYAIAFYLNNTQLLLILAVFYFSCQHFSSAHTKKNDVVYHSFPTTPFALLGFKWSAPTTLLWRSVS